jgi:carotenoid 1,2-hydratase
MSHSPPIGHNRQPPTDAAAESVAAAVTDTAQDLPPGYERRKPGIDFARPVVDNGYLWWYVDAISDDGEQALTMIIFVGSVFSPYYASARRRALREAEQHCAFNTIIYGPGSRKRWSMTERTAEVLHRDQHGYRLGPSKVQWDGRELVASINEVCVPYPRRMRGTIRVTPTALTGHTLLLDQHGRHRWHPLAPIARVEVDFPGLGSTWSGDGYLDSNEGSEPLADGFVGWDWTRARLANGDCAIRYEAREPMRQPHRLALRFDQDGNIHNEVASHSEKMPTTRVWRMPRHMPGAEGRQRIRKTLEDTPFYARSIVEADFAGEPGLGFHESLSMQRFEQRWVQTLLPFRMPRLG